MPLSPFLEVTILGTTRFFTSLAVTVVMFANFTHYKGRYILDDKLYQLLFSLSS